MKTVNITKLKRVDAPAGEYVDIVAFQLCEFVIDFFGNVQKFVLDTKIMSNGTQFVVNGNGFIPDEYQIQ
jgi:hypothetical protein